jgi:hypothetical protein
MIVMASDSEAISERFCLAYSQNRFLKPTHIWTELDKRTQTARVAEVTS